LTTAAMTSYLSTVALINWGARTPEGAKEVKTEVQSGFMT